MDDPMFTTDLNLAEGDVAVFIRKDATVQIGFNIPSMHETGNFPSGKDAAGMIMALALLEIIDNDDEAFAAACKRVINKLDAGSVFRVVTKD